MLRNQKKSKKKPKDGRKKRAEIKNNVVNVGPNISTSILSVIYEVLQIKD